MYSLSLLQEYKIKAVLKELPMTNILKLRIKIPDIKPGIWREILIKNDITFKVLHEIIQLSFGWTNSHLYNFDVNGILFSMPDKEFENNDLDVKNKITEFLIEKGQKAFYTYDFGDNWEHEIKIVDVLKKEKGIRYPKCLDGRRNGPPEDCGGIPGYEDVIDALTGKDKSEHEDLLEWLGNYDPEKFDIDKINKAILNPGKYLFEDPDL